MIIFTLSMPTEIKSAARHVGPQARPIIVLTLALIAVLASVS
jgi:hypothetical protein